MTDPLDNPSPLGTRLETICAPLTPIGRGAIAVIAIAGPDAESVLDQHFQPANRKTLAQNSSKTIIYGLWKVSEEDLVVYRRGEYNFEVHCHGGRSAPALILESLCDSGVVLISAFQFARAFENPWKVSVQWALAQATTARTAEHLLNQLKVLPNSIAQVRSLIESDQLQSAISKIETFLQWSDFGIHLTRPRSIVLCGKPNVGKSSLANAIIGFERAIVHSVPGTTRDVVTQLTSIDGWPVELKDTAGLRETADTIEAIGIDNAKTQIESADVRVCVFDLTTQWSKSDAQTLTSVVPHLIVHNKSDLTSRTELHRSDRPEGVLTSAATGRGVAELMQEISQFLVPSRPKLDQPIPVTPAQSNVLQTVLGALKTGDIVSAKTLLKNPGSGQGGNDSIQNA